MTDLRMDAQSASAYTEAFGNQLEEFSTITNSIATTFETLSNGSIWTGALNSNYTAQVNEFLPNLKLGYNIIEKTKNDLANCINNDIATDEC